MTEYRLFGDDVPYYSVLDFFKSAPHVPTAHQVGHAERTTMVENAVINFLKLNEINTLTDLGCGDGQLLFNLRNTAKKYNIECWGYDAGAENVEYAHNRKIDVRYADIINDEIDYGDLSVCCEVLEHLYDPRGFLRKIKSKFLIVSSPSAETPDWHYLEHAWAWDLDGYRELIESSGFRFISQESCVALGECDFLGNDIVKHPQFQCIIARRDI